MNFFSSGVDFWHRKPLTKSLKIKIPPKTEWIQNRTKQFCWPILLNLRKNCFKPLYTLCHCFNVFNSCFVRNWILAKNRVLLLKFVSRHRRGMFQMPSFWQTKLFPLSPLYCYNVLHTVYTALQPIRLSHAPVPFSSFVVATLFTIHQNIGNTHVLFS